MDKKRQYDKKKVEAVCNRNRMLNHIKDHDLTLDNAASALYTQFGAEYEETIHAPLQFKPTAKYQPGINFEQALLIFVTTIRDIKKVILNHMGFESDNAQKSFSKIPLTTGT